MKGKPIRSMIVVHWLNQDMTGDLSHHKKPTRASRVRVANLIHAIAEADALLASAAVAEPNRNFWINPPQPVSDAIEAVQQILYEYPLWQSAEISGRWGGGRLHFDNSTGPGRPVGEQVAVWDVIDLAKNQQLSRLRRCSCGRWYLAKRENQKACSPGCRHKAYEQTEAFKAKRRVYMRAYYKLKKSGRVK